MSTFIFVIVSNGRQRLLLCLIIIMLEWILWLSSSGRLSLSYHKTWLVELDGNIGIAFQDVFI